MPRAIVLVPISSPRQQRNALLATRDFLLRLSDPRQTPRIGGDVRAEARSLLRHYPVRSTLAAWLEACPWGELAAAEIAAGQAACPTTKVQVVQDAVQSPEEQEQKADVARDLSES